MIVVNFKNHKIGKDVLDLAKNLERVSKRKGFSDKISVCVPATDIHVVYSETNLDVFAQHVNNQESGSTTGFVTAENVASVGASGTLLNHSEHRIPFPVLYKIMERCHKEKLKVIVCVSSLREAKKLVRLKNKPYAIAFEDSRLIGSGKPITQYNPRAISKFVKILEGSRIMPLCGAGISSWKDVEAAYSLGCKGVLVASAITKSKKPEKFFDYH